MTIIFMGQEFPNPEQFKAAFPALSGNDAMRAIKAGASTPLEVEVAAFKDRNCGRKNMLKAVRKNGTALNVASARNRAAKAEKDVARKKRRRAA